MRERDSAGHEDALPRAGPCVAGVYPALALPGNGPSRRVIEVRGDVPASRGDAVRRTLAKAVDDLELDGIALHVRRSLPGDLVGAAGPDGIYVRRDHLEGDGLDAAATLLEEAAHYKMYCLGATQRGRDTFPGALVHEFFGAWYSWSELLSAVPNLGQRYDFHAVPAGRATPDYGYLLGRVLGAAAAGIEPAQERVEAWLGEALTEPGIKELARRLLALAAQARTAVQLAHELLPLFRRA
jgi:hypothetical protein